MNDSRITAYALNELQGAEREKFESDMATDPLLQRDLLAACEITDALGESSEEPSEGLEPQARARLLREIVANQEAFRARRKIIRFAVPVSLAAAASIALLLLVSGGTTTQNPAVAAASVPGSGDSPVGKKEPTAMLNRGNYSGAFTARLNSKGQVFTFKGEGSLSAPFNQEPSAADETEAGRPSDIFVVTGQRLLVGRTFNLSESAKIEGPSTSFSEQPVNLRERRLFSDELQRVGGAIQGAPVPQ